MNKVDEHLWVGNSRDGRTPHGNIDAILNVATDLDYSPPAGIYLKIGLVDGPGNKQEKFNLAVKTLTSLMEKGLNVLIHCHEGKSRSVAVAAAHLAKKEGSHLGDALTTIKKVRPVADPCDALLSLAQKYLDS
jgi:protein-tyrosine phosphatase